MGDRQPLLGRSHRFSIDSNGSCDGTTERRLPSFRLADWMLWVRGESSNTKSDEFDDGEQTDYEKPVGFLQLFRFTNRVDLILIFAYLCAVMGHALNYVFGIFIVNQINGLFAAVSFCINPDNEHENLTFFTENSKPWSHDVGVGQCDNISFRTLYNSDEISKSTLTALMPTIESKIMGKIHLLFILGFAQLGFALIEYYTWNSYIQRQMFRMNISLFQSLIQRNISYMDKKSTNQFNSKLFTNIAKIEKGIGSEFLFFFGAINCTVFGVLLSFFINWKLTLIVSCSIPFVIGSSFLFSTLSATETQNQLIINSKVASIVQEVFGSFRTVLSLNGSNIEKKRFKAASQETHRYSIREGALYGIYAGWLTLITCIIYTIGFIFGSLLTTRKPDSINLTDILIIVAIFADNVQFYSLVSPCLQSISESKVAAAAVFKLIDEGSIEKINETEVWIEDTKSLSNIHCDIEFQNISFTFPSRKDIPVLCNLSFIARAGQTTALVGLSGSGKSTCLSLILRYYEPSSGRILIDGRPITEYNVKQLRQNFGVVNQEPILFGTSIYENIRLGKVDATRAEIEEAATQANAHHFIMRLSNKYETLVGERGIQLSGGEKQRIALARALIKQPNVLLLDEATSALDNANERIVQEALDRNRKDRTTIIIAHRLNTIKNADYIYVLENGVLIEEGTHENLMVVPEGRYQAMFKRQEIERISDNMDDTPYMQKVTEEENLAYEYSHRLSMSEMVAEHKAVEKPFSQISVFLRLLTMNRPEWIIILIGCIGCIFVGGAQSLFGFLLARVIHAFKYYPGAKQRSHVLNASLIFLLVGVFILIARLVQYTAFAISGSKLTQRFRSQAFECLLRQEVAYFDRIEHSSGVISAHLSSGAIAVQELAGTRSGVICEIIALMLFGIALGSSLHWQIGLIIAASLCTFLIIIYTKCRIVAPLNEQIDAIAGQSSMFAIEVVQNLRTVKHLLVEKEVLRKYTGFVKQISILFRKSLIISTIEFSIYWAFDLYVLAFLYLCTFNLLKNHEIFANNIMMVLSVAIFSTQASKVIGFMSNRLAASFSGAEYFFNIFDRKPYIDNGSTEGQLLVDFHGNISFDQVKFIYPNRPTSIILKGFQLNIRSGQTVALVGLSGSGKSTIIQLLERFYDATKGNIFLDGIDIRQLNIHSLRSHFGLVTQEPVLFDLTIAENIAYGLEHVQMDEIISAAKRANIHQFIEQLSEGYETRIGEYGRFLSGGEKQRIAIARILIRRPKVFLFDEVTSAMDSYNEKIIQEALEEARIEDPSRTSIIIAHRLSTIRSCDVIYVVDEGRIIESGTHTELIERDGAYSKMLRQNVVL